MNERPQEINTSVIPFIPSIDEKSWQQERQFYNMPTSPTADLIQLALGSGSDVASLPDRFKRVSKGSQISVLEKNGARQIIKSTSKSTITLELSNIDNLKGFNEATKKIMILALIKLNNQNYSDELFDDLLVAFPLQELVDLGLYKNLDSARRAVKKALDTLTSIKAQGEISEKPSSKEKGEISKSHVLEVLFTGGSIKKGTCEIFFNKRIKWQYIAQYYTILPVYYFRLNDNASELMYYICFLARQQLKEIRDRGYFNIGLRGIQQRLNLPNEESTKNPKRDIIDVISKALADIQKEDQKHNSFTLTLCYNKNGNIREYLDGWLKVEPKGEGLEKLIAIAEKKQEAIDKDVKRRESITDKAKAINLAKKLNSQEASKK